LRLLLCAQPGLRPSIEYAAKGSAVLTAVIDEVLASDARNAVGPITLDIDVLQTGYKAPDGPSL
jgi:hypothetical protein